MPCRDRLAKRHHRVDMIGREGKPRRIGDVECLKVGFEGVGVMFCDCPDILAALLRGGLHLVVAGIGIAGATNSV